MNISRFAKAIVYGCTTIVLLIFSVIYQIGMHTEGALEETYFGSNTFLFLSAAVIMGVGAYSFLSYTRRHREHLWDSIFLVSVGALCMAAIVFDMLTYGGLEGPFTESGYTAANLNLVLLSALPLPFLLRTLILAFSTHEDKRARRLGIQIAAGVLTVGTVLLFVTGCMMNLLRFTPTPESNMSIQETYVSYE